MTFEELLQKVREAKNLHHVIAHAGMTYLTESWADDTTAYGLVVKHPAKGFEHGESGILACIGSVEGSDPDLIPLLPNQFFMLREALALNCEPWSEDE